MIEIKLPIISDLSSNRKNGHHWSKIQADKVNARTIGYYAAIDHKNAFTEHVKIKATIIFKFKDKRKRDLANFAEGAKNMIDGVFSAIGADDGQIDEWSYIRGEINYIDPHLLLTIEGIQ